MQSQGPSVFISHRMPSASKQNPYAWITFDISALCIYVIITVENVITVIAVNNKDQCNKQTGCEKWEQELGRSNKGQGSYCTAENISPDVWQ